MYSMETLNSLAEKNALKCTDLTNFRNFSLPGFKDEIKEMLDLIGRNSAGIFLTYTKHDISHINAMLDIAEWLIPDKTKSKLTSVDWLMLVLACYVHDLGMLTTDLEFAKRNDNEEYKTFKNIIFSDPKSEDYRKRISSSDVDQEKFYFQEFVRSTHARRIREWIKGENINKWNNGIGIIAQQINESLKKLPPRFVHSLAMVCESHHLNDLNDEAKYPLYETYGSSKEESANVQYNAIILRTLDLLHITKDRTPSITFKALNITDPVGILEWEKQLGTYSVLPISRLLKDDDPDTQIISVTADFIEERPFFTLSEYLAYADSQIKQSKGWIEKSSQSADGEGFNFPWHSVKGNIKVEGNDPIPLRFELDRGKLLDLLVGHTIYNDPTVVIRELLQNSIDAIRYRSYLEKGNYSISKIEVEWNSSTRELVIRDNGVGMDKFVIVNHLMKVGSSFYSTNEFITKNVDFSPISKFGIGILTCFMVSDDVEILTKKGEKGYRIRMTSVHSNYLLKELSSEHQDLDTLKRAGTSVKLKLRPSVDLSKRSIEQILRYWIIFPACQVLYTENKTIQKEIGFKNTKDAFEYFYLQDNAKNDIFKDIKIISDKKTSSTKENYEMSFATYTLFSNIPNFFLRRNTAPVVCLEGIRVLDNFPVLTKYAQSYSNYQGRNERTIAAIISIRNNSKIRTTVSRDGLEFDEEYIKVGLTCMDFLFEHIYKEISLIQESEGNPYSRASTAAEWLFDTIDNTFKGEVAKQQIQKKQNEIPSIVVEEIAQSKVFRKILPLNDFIKNKFFWTIESRLLNYLGTLSKDLGRELGFNTFIEKLAPDLLNNDISPLIIEYTSYDIILFENYCPEKCLYSQKHQQISVKWIQKNETSSLSKEILSIVESFEMDRQINQRFDTPIPIIDNSEYYGDGKDLLNNTLGKIYICDVIGDRNDIKAVVNEKNILLDKRSQAYKGWSLFNGALKSAINDKSIEDIYILIGGVYLFYRACQGKVVNRRRVSENKDLLWNVVSPKLGHILEQRSLSNEFKGETLSAITGDLNEWFNPAKYWFEYKDGDSDWYLD